MKTYQYQPETITELAKLPRKTMSLQSHRLGVDNHEPLIVAMDSMIRYAKAYKGWFGDDLASDYVLGPAWLATAKGIRDLCNGDGAVAYERGISTDSKDNGAVESMFCAAMQIAGYEEEDM